MRNENYPLSLEEILEEIKLSDTPTKTRQILDNQVGEGFFEWIDR